MFNKIIIGTAQFGQKYGISMNSKVKVNEQSKIINYGRKYKIKHLDTAPYYGNIKNCLKKYSLKNYNIILKMKSIDVLKKISKNDSADFFFKEYVKKNFSKVSCILLYGFDDLNLSEKKKIYKFILNLKRKKYIKKFGYTIYSFNKIYFICNEFKPDIIQCPFNIIDRRLVEKKYLNFFKKEKIEVHARSIFLQGLLLMEKDKIIKRFKKFSNIFEKWDYWLTKNNIKPVEACWNYITKFKQIDNYVIGFHELKQIKEIKGIKLKNFKFPNISSNNLKLINPGNWK